MQVIKCDENLPDNHRGLNIRELPLLEFEKGEQIARCNEILKEITVLVSIPLSPTCHSSHTYIVCLVLTTLSKPIMFGCHMLAIARLIMDKISYMLDFL